jgi:hypothetical protein
MHYECKMLEYSERKARKEKGPNSKNGKEQKTGDRKRAFAWKAKA